MLSTHIPTHQQKHRRMFGVALLFLDSSADLGSFFY